jgi:excinuclease ABC subunit B
MESPVSGREKGKHNKGRQRHRTVDESGQPLFAKPSLEEMGRAGDYSKPAGSGFRKPSLNDMGPGTDMPTPAGAISRSLFKKQSAREAHGSDFGIPGDSGRSQSSPQADAPSRSGGAVSENNPSMFRKNSLDEMTVRRTEKPVEGRKPVKPEDVKPIVRQRIGAGSYEDPAETSRHKRRPGKTGRPGK